MDIQSLRKEYRSIPLTLEEMHKDPIEQLKLWMRHAIDEGVVEPNAMILATASAEGAPSTRTVLAKQIQQEGLLFYTNYESRKGKEIAENPRVSATFYWKEMERQVSLDGIARKISEEESQSYFTKRSRDAQLGAWSSRQGEPLASRKALLDSFESYRTTYEGKEVPKPPYWGGYLFLPSLFIFWKGREHRLHDRFLYTKSPDGSWVIQRIAP